MAHATHTRHDGHPAGHHELPAVGASLLTFVVLFILAILALVVGFSGGFGDWKVLASLMVATVQAGVLAVFFMDLRKADHLTWLVAGSGIFWVGLMFLFILTDYFTRHIAVL